MEKGFEKIILQFTTDFENTLLKKGANSLQSEEEVRKVGVKGDRVGLD